MKKKQTSPEKEQKLWLEIQKLKERQGQEKSDETERQMETLECELSALQGKDITAIEAENITLKKKAILLDKELQELRKRHTALRKAFGSYSIMEETSGKRQESQSDGRLAKILLKKYCQLINEKEAKTVAEVKAMVSKSDLTVQSILQELKPENYSFEKDFEKTAAKALQYLSEEIQFEKADFGINFWLEPKEIIESGTSDDEDLAVLLCSLLYSLGDENCQVVITELDNLTTHAIVLTESNGKNYLLDPCQKHSFEKYSGKLPEILEKYSFNNAKIRRFLYKFNAENYEQFT